ncbi:hypothetical protein C8R47DRAFT_1210383 [Mycena vitilis]|nr:hypothetical protein C8R47DRAFT_1210383 [Mycena vitilis]
MVKVQGVAPLIFSPAMADSQPDPDDSVAASMAASFTPNDPEQKCGKCRQVPPPQQQEAMVYLHPAKEGRWGGASAFPVVAASPCLVTSVPLFICPLLTIPIGVFPVKTIYSTHIVPIKQLDILTIIARNSAIISRALSRRVFTSKALARRRCCTQEQIQAY